MQKLSNAKNSDFWQKLQMKREELIECQVEKGLKSCTNCESYPSNCNLRSEYVNSVYKSMSKGDIGGFEF